MRAVDGLLTGLHEPEASHLLMLEAVAGRAALRARIRGGAARHRYLWHEFGDVHLLLPDENLTLRALLKQLMVRLLRGRCEPAHRTHITYEGR